MKSRKLSKEEYTVQPKTYYDLIGCVTLRKQSCIRNIATREDIQLLLDNFRKDYPQFEHYRYVDVAYVLIMSDSIDQCLNVPVCYCGKLCVPVSYPYLNPKIKTFRKNCYDSECVQKSIVISHKKTCLDRYGTDNVSKIQGIKDKKRQRYIEHFGVDNPMKCESIAKKQSDNIEKKYGVSNVSKLDSIKEKKLDTFTKHYGSVKEWYLNILREYCSHFGVQNVSQLSWVKDKKRQTFIRNYGADNIFKTQQFKDYIKQYWIDHPAQYKEACYKCGQSIIKNKSKIDHYGKGGTGVIEFDVMNEIEREIGLKIYRQVGVIQYYVDGYIPQYNIVIEYDELNHEIKNQMDDDILRQREIFDYIDCTFVRIGEIDWICDPESCIQRVKDCINIRLKIPQQDNLLLKCNDKGRYRIHKKLES